MYKIVICNTEKKNNAHNVTALIYLNKIIYLCIVHVFNVKSNA